MLQMLKKIAMQQLAQKMAGNSLNANATGQAAEQGTNALIGLLTQQLGAGKLDQVKALLSGQGEAGDNNIASELQNKLASIMQEKGMNAEEAQQEAANTAPDLLNGLKEKFLSNDEADSAFDISALGDLLQGGDAGDLLNKAKGLF